MFFCYKIQAAKLQQKNNFSLFCLKKILKKLKTFFLYYCYNSVLFFFLSLHVLLFINI